MGAFTAEDAEDAEARDGRKLDQWVRGTARAAALGQAVAERQLVWRQIPHRRQGTDAAPAFPRRLMINRVQKRST